MYIFVIPFSDTLTSVPGLSSEGLGYSCLGEYGCPCLGVQLPTAIRENTFCSTVANISALHISSPCYTDGLISILQIWITLRVWCCGFQHILLTWNLSKQNSFRETEMKRSSRSYEERTARTCVGHLVRSEVGAASQHRRWILLLVLLCRERTDFKVGVECLPY